MAKQYYECHITCEGDKLATALAIDKIGWTFSCIDGDPDLGSGTKCYATKQFNARHEDDGVIGQLTTAAIQLRKLGVKVLREKVELVLFDKRETANEE